MTTRVYIPSERRYGTVVSIAADGLVWVVRDGETTSTGYAPGALEPAE